MRQQMQNEEERKVRDQNCIFCKIANGEIPSAEVYEDAAQRAF